MGSDFYATLYVYNTTVYSVASWLLVGTVSCHRVIDSQTNDV